MPSELPSRKEIAMGNCHEVVWALPGPASSVGLDYNAIKIMLSNKVL